LTQPNKLKTQGTTKIQNQEKANSGGKKAHSKMKVTRVFDYSRSPSNLKTENTTRDKSASKTLTANLPQFKTDLLQQYHSLVLKVLSRH